MPIHDNTPQHSFLSLVLGRFDNGGVEGDGGYRMHQQTVAVAGVLRVSITPVSGNPWWLTGPAKIKSTPFHPPNPG